MGNVLRRPGRPQKQAPPVLAGSTSDPPRASIMIDTGTGEMKLIAAFKQGRSVEGGAQEAREVACWEGARDGGTFCRARRRRCHTV